MSADPKAAAERLADLVWDHLHDGTGAATMAVAVLEPFLTEYARDDGWMICPRCKGESAF